ncbi:MAG: phage tail tape measure protein [Oscillospiraceae bacterium]|nr:phage tail tape measure protein [Oscillospiraceae bacterium]
MNVAGKTLKEIAEAMTACVDASIEFESAMTGVAKTTDLSGDALAQMGEDLKEMSTRIPLTAEELAGIAESAGQLGIAKGDILGFTEVMANLGVATNLSSAEAAASLAKFANITKMSADDYERLGSVIVGLGNNFATTETDIVNMATNLASTGELVGLSEAEIMAASTALSSLGIEAAAGGTSMSKLLKSLETMVATGSKDLEKFASIAGMSSEEFASSWNQEALPTLAQFINGLGDLDKNGGNAIVTLADLGITETRMSNAVLALASSDDILTKSIALANTEWANNTALANEAALRYETTESKMTMLSSSFNNVKIAVGDQLKPALDGLLDVGLDAAEWAAALIEKCEWLGPLLAGVATAMSVLVAVFGGYILVTKAVTLVTTALGGATAAIPFVAVAAAVTGLIAALAAFAAAHPGAQTEQEKLAKSMKETAKAAEESRKAYADAKKEISENSSNVSEMAARLDELSKKTNLSASETEIMNGLIDGLNESVPNLNLAYDTLNGTLTLTSEKILEIAKAEEERANSESDRARLIELDKQIADSKKNLASAAEQYTKALMAQQQYERTYTSNEGVLLVTDQYWDLVAATNTAKDSSDNARETVNGLQTEFDELSGKIDAAAGATKEDTDETDANTAAHEANLKVINESAEKYDTLKKSASELSKASGLLSAALTEQSDAGSLNIDTINGLVDAGYASALQIDDETGAVTVNRDAYIALAQAKIAEQIAAAQIDRAALVSAINAEKTAANGMADAATAAALANVDLAKTKWALTAAEQEQLDAFDAQIDALTQLGESIGKTTAARVSGGSAARSAAKTEVDAAESAAKAAEAAAKVKVDAFKKAKDELDHLRAMDLIGEMDYYKEIAAARDEYLTGEDVLDEYRKTSEDIYKYQSKMLEEGAKGFEDYLKNIDAEFKDAVAAVRQDYDELVKAQEQMRSKLSSYGGLTETETVGTGASAVKKTHLADVQKQIDELNNYNDVLTQLRDKNVPTSLMSEILGMGVDGAIEYGSLLLSQSEDQWSTYMGLYQQKQELSGAISKNYYQEDFETVTNNMDELTRQVQEKIAEGLGQLQDTGKNSGEMLTEGMIEGLQAKKTELMKEAAELAAAAEEAIREQLGIHSPSTVGRELMGFFGDGLNLGFEDAAEKLRYTVARAMPSTLVEPIQDTASQTADMVNAFGTLAAGMQSAGGGNGGGNTEVVFKIDSVTFARVLLPVIRQIGGQLPEITPDF